ncbi:uncharacterized protein G2W53_028108 [Senna tora]|uniref:Uncharacterized protein n=1 Tax=Senna tora TaxID=362788 RepID=A0A834TBV7_9FABA|nr:uncharacterized protein G2W53_028108 [Senna tora]
MPIAQKAKIVFKIDIFIYLFIINDFHEA